MRSKLSLIAAFLLAMPAPLPAASMPAQAPVPLLIRAGKWLVSTVAGYFVGKAIDRALGREYEQQLAEAEARLRREIAQAAGDRAALENEHRVTQSQLETVRSLLSGTPSKAELEQLRVRVDADLGRVLAVLGEQGQRLDIQDSRVRVLESEVVTLRATLDSLRTNRKEVAAARNPRLRPGPYGTIGGGLVSLESRAQQSSLPIDASDSRIGALGRFGWRSSKAVSVGLEATFWMRTTKVADHPAGGTVSLSTPFQTFAGTLALPLYLTPGPSFPLFVYGGPGIAIEFDRSGDFDTQGRLTAPTTKKGAGFAYVAGGGVEIQTSQTASLLLFARYSSSRYSMALPRGQGTAAEALQRRMLFVGVGVSFNRAKYAYPE